MSDHFEGKSVAQHLKEARARGMAASAEIHGTEMPGHIGALTDASKEMALALVILWMTLSHFFAFQTVWLPLLLFAAGWIIWKTARNALLGWARIERLHRLIEEERWEIEHHRAEEREELTEMYRAKGLSGKMLDEVIDVLMADDNRLLRVMLEEELGLTLEVYEHPLKQALGALIGSLLAGVFCLLGLWAFHLSGLVTAAAIVIVASSVLSAKLQKSRAWNTAVWNLAVAGLVVGSVYFLIPLVARG